MRIRKLELKDSLIIFGIIMVIISLIAFAFNSSLKTSEEKRQTFENNLLQTVDENQKVIVHNQGVIIKNDGAKAHNQEVIIHNQIQFSKYGMATGNGTQTPDIRTDFQQTSTDYWLNFTENESK